MPEEVEVFDQMDSCYNTDTTTDFNHTTVTKSEPEPKGDIAMIGLGVMGRAMALNLADRGFNVSVYNYTRDLLDSLMDSPDGTRENLIPCLDVKSLVASLKRPRKIVMLIPAGAPVDQTLSALTPHLESGDIVIDGGNSEYSDTVRRCDDLSTRGIRFVGCGVSGGEEGARNGPSLMPGGDPGAWSHIEPLLTSIAAKTPSGEPCCTWIGPSGSGHFVKTVHNGIEYADMQLIAEAYDLMTRGLGLSPEQIGGIFEEWNSGPLDSYLIEITARVLKTKDSEGKDLVPQILDSASQKGTGAWTAIAGLNHGQPIGLLAEAVFSRCISAKKPDRLAAAKIYSDSESTKKLDLNGFTQSFIADIGTALYASKIIAYAQAFGLLSAASQEHDWSLNLSNIALAWRGGCIIRSRFLGQISSAFAEHPERDGLATLLADEYFSKILKNSQEAWRRIVCTGIAAGIPLPAFSSALAFFDSYRSPTLPANLIQAQRDFFGAHTFELVQQPGVKIHNKW